MSKGDKYIPLHNYLKNLNESMVKLSFEDIERIIRAKLPASATNHSEAWWSNSPSSSQATSWLKAGYQTDFVTDTHKIEHVIFIKI